MAYHYFHIIGILSRISIDENSDPIYCETYDPQSGKFVRNNSILEDLYNHSDSVEISKDEFEKRLAKIQNSGVGRKIKRRKTQV